MRVGDAEGSFLPLSKAYEESRVFLQVDDFQFLVRIWNYIVAVLFESTLPCIWGFGVMRLKENVATSFAGTSHDCQLLISHGSAETNGWYIEGTSLSNLGGINVGLSFLWSGKGTIKVYNYTLYEDSDGTHHVQVTEILGKYSAYFTSVYPSRLPSIISVKISARQEWILPWCSWLNLCQMAM